MNKTAEHVSFRRLFACAREIHEAMNTPEIEAFSAAETFHALILLAGTHAGLGLLVIDQSQSVAEALPMFGEGYVRGFELEATKDIAKAPASGRTS